MTMAFAGKKSKAMDPEADAKASVKRPDMGKSKEMAPTDEGPHEEKDIHSVVAEHGPANDIQLKHDHAAGKHEMHSKHGGYTHHSSHGSAEEAHSHARIAAGIPESEQSPEETNQPMDSMQMSSIPGM